MRMSRYGRVAAFLLISLIAMSVAAAAADYAGDPYYVTNGWDGRRYSAMSILRIMPDDDGGSDVGAGVEVLARDGLTITNSSVRVRPQLFLDGSLWATDGWHYSAGNDNGLYAEYFTYFVSRHGNVFSRARFGFYNGTGYTDYNAEETRTIAVNSVRNRAATNEAPIQEEFGINLNGQTYGSGWGEETPELIKAIGAGGVHGYVYNAELMALGDKDSPDDIAADIPDSIPLYDVDGTTVIGEFLIGCLNE